MSNRSSNINYSLTYNLPKFNFRHRYKLFNQMADSHREEEQLNLLGEDGARGQQQQQQNLKLG